MPQEERSVSSTGGQKGVKNAQYNLIPVRPLELLAEHFGKGAKKYERHQWRKGYEWSKSYDSLLRHLQRWWGGEEYDVCSNDPEGCLHEYQNTPWEGPADTCWNHTGSHHLQAVMWHSVVLMEFYIEFPQFDDRHIYDRPEAVETVSVYSEQSLEPVATYSTGPLHLVSPDGDENRALCCGIIVRDPITRLLTHGITLDPNLATCKG
jgi:hypothetical protein